MGLAEMQKAFDKAALVEELKAQGLPMAEEAVEKLAGAVFAWIKKSGEIHEQALVKAIVPPGVDLLWPVVKGQLDKIDGVEG